MFDAPDAPAVLIKHEVVQHAANREFRIFLDGIILQVLVAAVAVHEIFPFWMARADTSTKSQAH